MITKNKNLIEYIGLSKYFPNNLKIFKKATLKAPITLLDTEPSVNQITKVFLEIQLIETVLIDTATGHSLDGNILTGKKLICYALANYKIYYISNEKPQTIQFYNSKLPIVESIVVPTTYKQECNIATSIFVDDILCQSSSEKDLFLYSSFVISCD
ncbi:MAG: hypothetical protein ACRCWG_11985 [Sarcina sp.]